MISKKNKKLGAPGENLREQKAEDVQRITNILNRRTKKDKKKNPFLNAKGGLDLIEKFPGIDFIPYEKRRIKNQKRDDRL